MPDDRRPLWRGEIIGKVIELVSTSEADCNILCPDCGGYFDIRDLAR